MQSVPSAKSFSHNGTRVWLRRALSLILLGLLIYFFWPLFGEIKAAAGLFRRAEWIWLGIAIALQVVSYGFLTWLNALSLQPFSGKIRFGPLTAVLTAMAFISVAVPSAGISGVAMRVRMLRKYGYRPEEALFSMVVETVLELIALVSVGILGVAYLVESGRLEEGNVVFISAIGIISIITMWYGWILVRDPVKSRRIAFRLVAIWNRLGGRIRHIEEDYVEERLEFFQVNLSHYHSSVLWKLPLAAYGKVLLDVLCLGAAFRLFGYNISPSTLLIGYGLVLSFSGLGALPGGLAMTDAMVPIIFSWLKVPGSVAIAAGLIYRLIAYWLVRFAGYISWLFLERPR
jgi:uncharacterized protein (TIRG00374 family)